MLRFNPDFKIEKRIIPFPASSLPLTPVQDGDWSFLVCPADIKSFPDNFRPLEPKFILLSVQREAGKNSIGDIFISEVQDIKSAKILNKSLSEKPVVTFSRQSMIHDVIAPFDYYNLPPLLWHNIIFLKEHPAFASFGKPDDTLYTLGKRCLGLDFFSGDPLPSSFAYAWWIAELSSLFGDYEAIHRSGQNPDGGKGDI